MRTTRPYIHLFWNKEIKKYEVHAFVVVPKGEKLVSKKIEFLTNADKPRSNGNDIACRVMKIAFEDDQSALPSGPFLCKSDGFDKEEGIDHVWVKIIKDGGSGDPGGVANYEDPDGD